MPKRKCNLTEELKTEFPCFQSGREEWEAECLVGRPATYVCVKEEDTDDLETHTYVSVKEEDTDDLQTHTYVSVKEEDANDLQTHTYVSVKEEDANDLQTYVNSDEHEKAVRGESSLTKLTDYFVRPRSRSEDAVTAAEGAFVFHTVKHQNSFKSIDCTSVLLKTTFPDSEVARKFSSARTKTEAIVISVLAPHSVDVVLKTFEENDIAYCGVATDGRNHGSVKIFPVIIQYFDWKNGGLQSKLIEVHNTPNETADTIAHYIEETLEKNGLFEKCIAFTGDNCNTMFGGLRCDEDGKNVFSNLKKLLQKRTLIGVGCPAHILNNCVHHAAENMNIDIENIIFKIYQYFHIYAVQPERLKEYCEFVDVEYRKLLSHSKTQWLSLFPGITKLIQMFPALKSFFLSQDKPPTVLKKFFEYELSEIYLWHMHSLMSVFQTYIQEIERESNSVVEVLKSLNSVHTILLERKTHNFMSLKVKGLLAQKRMEGIDEECDKFCAEVDNMYSRCIEYLEKCLRPLEDFSCFRWVTLNETPNWSDVEPCIKYLIDKGVQIDDVKCFDQFSNLKKFTESCNSDEEFSNLLAHQKWTKYFEKSKNIESHSELLKIAQFFFAIPSHNANVGQIFSLMQSQWTEERNNLNVELLKGTLLVQYNFRQTSCKDFHAFLKSNQPLLRKMQSTEMYVSAHEEKENW